MKEKKTIVGLALNDPRLPSSGLFKSHKCDYCCNQVNLSKSTCEMYSEGDIVVCFECFQKHSKDFKQHTPMPFTSEQKKEIAENIKDLWWGQLRLRIDDKL